MNNKAQFTLVCTCEIVMRTGETLDSSLGDKPCSDISRIVLCPLHDAAPAMYEALQEALKCIEKHVPKTEFAPRQWIREVLAQSEGKRP
jgi:hypothetical protein